MGPPSRASPEAHGRRTPDTRAAAVGRCTATLAARAAARPHRSYLWVAPPSTRPMRQALWSSARRAISASFAPQPPPPIRCSPTPTAALPPPQPPRPCVTHRYERPLGYASTTEFSRLKPDRIVPQRCICKQTPVEHDCWTRSKEEYLAQTPTKRLIVRLLPPRPRRASGHVEEEGSQLAMTPRHRLGGDALAGKRTAGTRWRTGSPGRRSTLGPTPSRPWCPPVAARTLW